MILDILRFKVDDGGKSASKKEVTGLSRAVLKYGDGDVYHEDCLDVEFLRIVGREDALVATVHYIS